MSPETKNERMKNEHVITEDLGGPRGPGQGKRHEHPTQAHIDAMRTFRRANLSYDRIHELTGWSSGTVHKFTSDIEPEVTEEKPDGPNVQVPTVQTQFTPVSEVDIARKYPPQGNGGELAEAEKSKKPEVFVTDGGEVNLRVNIPPDVILKFAGGANTHNFLPLRSCVLHFKIRIPRTS